MSKIGGYLIIDLKGKYNTVTKVYDDADAFKQLENLKGRKFAVVEVDDGVIPVVTTKTQLTDGSSKKYYLLKGATKSLLVYADKVIINDEVYLPDMSELASNKSYYLECVNGTLTWVEVE